MTESTTGDLQKPPASSARIHLEFLDGMRGLAALYVVFHHAFLEYVSDGFNGMQPWVAHFSWLCNGAIAVDVFIALSGYCLMIPVARSNGELRGGIREFSRRRAWRILPTYYAALAICLLLDVLIPPLVHNRQLEWSATLPTTSGAIFSHIFMLQWLKNSWAYAIDYPAWSIPIEWWTYGLFAFALVPLWKRLGPIPVAIISIIIGCGLRNALGNGMGNLRADFIGVFGIGMMCASFNFASRDKLPPTIKLRVFALAALLAVFAFFVALHFTPRALHASSALPAALAGAGAGALMAWGTQHKQAGTMSPLLAAMESRPAVALGAISYSLYLIHAPILSLVHLMLSRTGLGLTTQMIIEIIVGVPASLTAGWVLWRAVERWSIAQMAAKPQGIRERSR